MMFYRRKIWNESRRVLFSGQFKMNTTASTKNSSDIRENIHQKIAGRSRFYKYVGFGPVEDGKVRVMNKYFEI